MSYIANKKEHIEIGDKVGLCIGSDKYEYVVSRKITNKRYDIVRVLNSYDALVQTIYLAKDNKWKVSGEKHYFLNFYNTSDYLDPNF